MRPTLSERDGSVARLVLLLALLVVSVTAVAGLVGANQSVLTIDADHALTDESQKAQFEERGVARAHLGAPEMTFTVADKRETKGCDVQSFQSNIRNDFLCIKYNEEIDRQIRFFVPNEYWSPYRRVDVEELDGGPTAEFEPVENGDYTAVTVTLSESGTYAYPVTKEASWFAGTRDRSVENLENVTGVGMPETEAWEFIAADQLADKKSAYVVRAPNGTDNLLLEYKTGPEEWTTVPDSPKDYAPVYYQTKSGVDDRVYVFATTDDPPRVRYKTKAGSTDQIGSAFREIGQVPGRLEEMLGIDIPFIGG